MKTKRKIIAAAVAALLVVVAFVVLYKSGAVTNRGFGVFSPQLKMHVLDVGDANAVIITYLDKTVVVDVGEEGDAEYIKRYLKVLNVKTVDYLVITHAHADHYGGYRALEDVDIKTAYLPSAQSTEGLYDKFLKMLRSKCADIRTAVPGDAFSAGEAVFMFIAPFDGIYEDLNDTSYVIMLSCGDVKLLLPGDMEGEEAGLLLTSYGSLGCDVYLCAHHGSASQGANSEDFIKEISPDYTVISSNGENSPHGFPHKPVLIRLESVNSKIYRTDINGAVTVATDGKSVKVTSNFTGSELPNRWFFGVIGNKKTKVYHRKSCGGLPNEANRVYFRNAGAADNAAYKPCEQCMK